MIQPNLRLWLMVAVLTALTACSSPVTYNTDFKTGYDFGHFETYAWQPGDQAQRRAENAMINDRITAEVNSNLQAKGFSMSTAPDFFVNYSVAANDQVDVKQYEVYEGYDPGWIYYPVGFGGPATPRVGWGDFYSGTSSELVMYTMGTLVVDVIDAKTGKLVWRGAAKGKLDSQLSATERDKVIQEVVQNLLIQFPPR